MKDFKDKVAVITGAASGIGLAVAHACAARGMKLVLADIEQGALAEVSADFTTPHITRYTDVSKQADIEELADAAYDEYGAVHFLFNNAGVGGAGSTIWETTAKDWEWTLNVNVWSIIHAINAFVPRMIDQADESYIVNTASIAGLISGPSMGAYRMSKHAVVSISETLYHELKQANASVGVSVLCPAWVKTKIFQSERNRPNDLQNEDPFDFENADPQIKVQLKHAMDSVKEGISADTVAEAVFTAMETDNFYILTHEKFTGAVAIRMKDILEEGRNPTNLMAS